MEPEEETDWFGHPLGPRDGGARSAAGCPYCDRSFDVLAALEAHLVSDHAVRLPGGSGRLGRARRWWDSLGYLPLWFVLPLDLLLVAVVVGTIWPLNPWRALYAGGLATLPLVLVLSHRIFRRPV